MLYDRQGSAEDCVARDEHSPFGGLTRGTLLAIALVTGVACARVERTPAPHALPAGEWTGDLHAPELPAAIGFLARVHGAPDTLQIVALEAMGFSGGIVTGLRKTADTVRFTWDSEDGRACALVRGAGGVFTGECTRPGDSPWRVRLLPPANRREAVGHAHSMLARADRTWSSRDTEWGRLHVAAGAADSIVADTLVVEQRAAAIQQAITHGIALLGSSRYDRPLDAFLLRDRADILALSGQRAASTADALGSTVLLARYGSMPGVMRHEIMHVLSINLWGVPPEPAAWVREGIATYAAGSCRGYGFHQLSASLATRGELVSVRQLLDEFYRHSDLVTYLQSASIFQFLYETRGREYARAVWQSGLAATLERDGRTVDGFEKEWRAAIASPEHHPDRVDWGRIKDGNGCG
ncbi:MAG: hypothetical protein V4617_11130 [Gemmatimonadota bacterium]